MAGRRRRFWARLRRWIWLSLLPPAVAACSGPSAGPPAGIKADPGPEKVPPPLVHAPPTSLPLTLIDGSMGAPDTSWDVAVDPATSGAGTAWIATRDEVFVRLPGSAVFREIGATSGLATGIRAVGTLGGRAALVGYDRGSLLRVEHDGQVGHVTPIDLAGAVHEIRPVSGQTGRAVVVSGAFGLAAVSAEGLVVDERLPHPADIELWTAAKAPSGDLWFGTILGVTRLAGGASSLGGLTAPTVDLAAGANDDVDAIDVCSGGDLWVATLGNGAFHLDASGTVLDHLTRSATLPQDHLLTAACDPTGGVWLGTSWGGLVRVHPDGTVDYDTRDGGLPGDSIRKIVAVPDGIGGRVMWIATEGGVATYDGP